MHLEELRAGDGEAAHDDGNPPGPPEWLDPSRFERGCKFFQRNAFSHMLAMFFSLVAGLSVSNLLEPLVFTRQSDQPRKAMFRYLSTFYHICLWHYRDIWDKPDGQAYVSMKTVREMHSTVRRNMEKAEKGNSESDGRRLSQYDMSLVQCGFMGTIIMYPDAFGARYTREDLEDYVYFWRVIGYELGISDENNICAEGLDSAYTVCKEIERDILKPALMHPPMHFENMARAVIEGVNLMFKALPFKIMTLESALCFGYNILGVDRRFWPRMSFGDYLRNLVLKILLLIVHYVPRVRRYLNNMTALIMDAPIFTSAPQASS